MTHTEHTAYAMDRILCNPKNELDDIMNTTFPDRKNRPYLLLETELDLGDVSSVTIEVYGRITESFPGTRETPEEPAYPEVTKVLAYFSQGDAVQITPSVALSEWLDEQIMEDL